MLERDGHLVPWKAARHALTTYGEEFVYKDKNGNWALRKDILNELRKLTDDGTTVWSRHGQFWRKRKDGDPQGRLVR